MSKRGQEALECLRRAVYDEMVKKAKLGQDVIVERDGKPCKISAAEAVRQIEQSRARAAESTAANASLVKEP
ncbi:MAG: hypothetical protein WCH86_00255 [Kiritimatiellales bacterium]